MEQAKINELKRLLEGLRRPNKDPDKRKPHEWQTDPHTTTSASIELPKGHFIFSEEQMGKEHTMKTMLEESHGAYTLDKDDNKNIVAISVTPAARMRLAYALQKCIIKQERLTAPDERSSGGQAIG